MLLKIIPSHDHLIPENPGLIAQVSAALPVPFSRRFFSMPGRISPAIVHRMEPSGIPLFTTFSEKADSPRRLLRLVIRQASLEDVPGLAEVTAAREGVSPEKAATGVRQKIELQQEGLGLVLVGLDQEEIAGFGSAFLYSQPPEAPGNAAPAGWYLSGLIVPPPYRRLGVGRRLTAARLAWIRKRAGKAFYFANALNRASIKLHDWFGFKEMTRDFWFPGACFTGGGAGILFVLEWTGASRRRGKAGSGGAGLGEESSSQVEG